MSTITQEPPIPRTKVEQAPLILRIFGGGLDGRIVRLASPKCTVGSGPRCTLRLVGPGIRPLHCLIVRGARGTFVRRWSPNTRLNGRSFEDAVLRTGDRLTIGPLELEILQQRIERGADTAECGAERGTDDALAAEFHAFPVAPAVANAGAEYGDSPPRSEAPRSAAQPSEEIRAQVASLRSRARNLVEALRESRQQQEELEARVDASLQAQAETDAKISQITSEARAAGELQHRVSSLSEELAAYKEREQALARQLQESKEREAALQRDVDEMSSANSQRDDAIESRLAELEREREEVERLRTELEADRERLIAEQAAVQAALSEPGQPEVQSPSKHAPREPDFPQTDEVAARPREADERDEDHERAEPSEADATEETATPESPSAPESFIAKYAPHLLVEDEASDRPHAGESGVGWGLGADAAHLSAEAAAQESTRPVPPPQQAAGEEEDSLEEYMAKLMQRVRGDDAPRAPIAAPAQVPPRANERKSSASTPPAVEDEAPPATFRWEDVKRAAAPPERTANFAAMRELANQSAHSAISRYGKQRRLRDAVGKWIAGGICLCSGLGTLNLAPAWQSTASLGGAAALLAAAYFIIRGTLGLLAFRRDRQVQRQADDDQKPLDDSLSSSPEATAVADVDVCEEAIEVDEQVLAEEVRRLAQK